jgi:hypothetical protein
VKALKNPKFLLTMILLAIIAATTTPHAYSSTLTLTVSTSKSFYVVTDDINVNGNLAYDSSPVPDWAVALEVQDPYGTTVVTRTPQTDTEGRYNVTFKLPINSILGTYTAYVSSGYKGETATNSTTIELMPRDIAVTNVTLSKNFVGQGYLVNVTVTVENRGYSTETFNVTLYANATLIHTLLEITLANGNSTILQYTWNTTGFVKGNYTMRACSWPFYGEANILNNICTDGWVLITKVGDIGSRVGSTNTFGVFDDLVTSTDLNLFLQCYKATAPSQFMYLGDLGSRVGSTNKFFVCDGSVTSTDLNLFLQCYKGTGP